MARDAEPTRSVLQQTIDAGRGKEYWPLSVRTVERARRCAGELLGLDSRRLDQPAIDVDAVLEHCGEVFGCVADHDHRAVA